MNSARGRYDRRTVHQYEETDTGTVAPAQAWSVDEVAKLRELWAEGARDEHIAEVLQRSVRGVCCKRNRLGLRHYSRNTRPVRARSDGDRVSYLRETLDTLRALARARRPHHEIEREILDALAFDERGPA